MNDNSKIVYVRNFPNAIKILPPYLDDWILKDLIPMTNVHGFGSKLCAL